MHLPQNTRLYSLPEIYAQRQTPLGLALCQLWVDLLNKQGVPTKALGGPDDVERFLQSYLDVSAHIDLLVFEQALEHSCHRHTLLGLLIGIAELDAAVPVANVYHHDVISGAVLGPSALQAVGQEMQQRFLRYTFEIGQQRGSRGTVVDLCLPDTSGPSRFRFIWQDGHFVPQP